MNAHFLMAADHGHLRIFEYRQEPGQLRPSLAEVDSVDFPHGVKSYAEENSDMAGRFQGSRQPSRAPGSPTARIGMSIDERLPLQREDERRRVQDIVDRIETFLRDHPDITWDFAAGPTLNHAVVECLSPQARAGLQRVVAKDLVHQPVAELLMHLSS